MIEPHLRRLRKRSHLSSEEEAAIRAAFAEVREHGPDRTIIRRGEPLKESLLLLSGWMARSKVMADGQRHLSILHIAGDFVDLHGYALQRLDHDVITLSPCRIAVMPHDRLRDLTHHHAHIDRLYWFLTTLDAAIHREWAASLGTCSAIERMAQLFCELLVRLEIVGETRGMTFHFPLTQIELGELLGMSPVHVNRTLQALRRRGLIELENRLLVIRDLPTLQKLCNFSGDYLYLEPMTE